MIALVTKRLSQELIGMIKSNGWSCDTIETLKIELCEVDKIPVSKNWVVSSRNSFHAIKKFINSSIQHIFCVGEWMKNEIERLQNGVTVKSFENMKSLAYDLSNQNFESVTYFCGEEHRQELEEGLKNTFTKIEKVITHKSEMIFPKLKINYDAVFIFSPRSAESLLKNNSFSANTVFACIGNTTADYLMKCGLNNIFVSSYPDSKTLIEEFYNR